MRSEFQSGAGEANLHRLNEVTDQLSFERGNHLRNHLLGGVLCYIDAETFAQLLELAAADLDRLQRVVRDASAG